MDRLLVVALLSVICVATASMYQYPVGNVDRSAWDPIVQQYGGTRRFYVQRKDIVSQRDIMGNFPNADFVPDGPERVYYRRTLTPIYAKPEPPPQPQAPAQGQDCGIPVCTIQLANVGTATGADNSAAGGYQYAQAGAADP